MRNMTFVGGPWDGDWKVLETLLPIRLFGTKGFPHEDGAFIGRYVHGERGKRGKMIWHPAEEVEAP